MTTYSLLLLFTLFFRESSPAVLCPTPTGDFEHYADTITTDAGVTVAERTMINLPATNKIRLSGFYTLSGSSGVLFSVAKSGLLTW
jgi:hypothetical protein